jgi:AraC family transcriptional activator of mtrCDE
MTARRGVALPPDRARRSAGRGGADGLPLQGGDIIVFPHGARTGCTSAIRPSHAAARQPGLLRYEHNRRRRSADRHPVRRVPLRYRWRAGLLAALPPVLVVRTAGRPDAQSLRH